MRGYFAPNRLDRIIANKAGFHPASLKDSEFTYEEIRRKLTVLVQEKRFLIYALLKTAPDHGFTHPEISAAIGTGGDKFEFHLSTLCRERILILTRDEVGIPRFRINPAFASALGLFFT
jgi:hypothetical protein